MAQPESVVVDAMTRALERRGCLVVKMHGSAFSRKGFPDLIIIRPDGVTVYVEAKVPGRTDGPLRNGVSAAQLSWGKRIKRQGAVWGFASAVDEVITIVFSGSSHPHVTGL